MTKNTLGGKGVFKLTVQFFIKGNQGMSSIRSLDVGNEVVYWIAPCGLFSYLF